MREIILLAHNLRSTHNVGSLLRTAEGMGVTRVYLTGYTPYPWAVGDKRLPHEARKLHAQIEKTALGAEKLVNWQQSPDVLGVVAELKSEGYKVYALEQSGASQPLAEWAPPDKIGLVLGREVEGLEPEVLAVCDGALEIPMFGQKESFNVVQAAAMALFYCRFK